jgi:phytoene synthase
MNASNVNFTDIIRRASKTFYIASLFFPKAVRRDVHILYSFLRISDDLVDAVPPRANEFRQLKEELEKSLAGENSSYVFISAFSDLVRRKEIGREIIFDYLSIQEMDLKKRRYESYIELDKFIYGVAGVVGLMMAKVMDLKEESFPGAIKLASAMQNVNIIRDIAEDLLAGKVYLPQDELRRFNLPDKLSADVARRQPEAYEKFIKFQLERAQNLLMESRESFIFIPKRILLPIKIVADVYDDVIKRITSRPYSVFERKMRPKPWTIIRISLKNYFL